MSIFTQTASAQTPARQTGADLRSIHDIKDYVNTHWDELIDEVNGEINHMELGALFREGSQTKDTEVIKSKVKGNATVPMNEDGDEFDFINWGNGWDHNVNVYQYRLAVQHTRHLSEVEGAHGMATISQEAQELADATKRTMKNMYGDFWNRAVNPTSGAQVLSPDGMYLIDSARPNPVDGVPDWSNLEDTTSLSEDMLFEVELNASNQIAHNGDDLDTSVQKIHIPKSYGLEMWHIAKTMKDPTSGMNTANWAAGRFPYEEHSEFTSNIILYELAGAKSDANPCEIRWAIRPSNAPLTFQDPDIIGQRVRFRVGLAITGDPRKMWRGGELTALS